MKQMEPKDITVQGMQFHVFPFPAFKAANISGELAALIAPILGGLAPMLGGGTENPLDIDAEKAVPAITGALNTLSGDKVEEILKKLLVTGQNITVDIDGKTVYLTESLANELFCMEAQGLYMLAFEVVRCNFGGFFAKLGSLSGSAAGKVKQLTANAAGTGV